MKNITLTIVVSISIIAIIIAICGYLNFRNNNYIYMTNEGVKPVNNSDIQSMRQPAVSGSFYPSNPDELNGLINKFMADAILAPVSGTPKIIIAPHAGYMYSGAIAASAFKTASVNTNISRVFIIGRSHQAYFNGIALDEHDAWQSPLGTSLIDKELYDNLKSYDFSTTSAGIHAKEHSLEVMLPFIQHTFGLNTKIIPILFGDDNQESEKIIAKVLSQYIDINTLVVISTDLSHYPTPENAKILDNQTISAILSNNAVEFHKELESININNPGKAETLACGETAIGTALFLSEFLNLNPMLITSTNSGEVFPELSANVVGYASIVFTTREILHNMQVIMNSEQQKTALKIARSAIEASFAKNTFIPEINSHSIFNESFGAFVTLKIDGELRGCIGVFEPKMKLSSVISEMAVSAAFEDPRFLPLKESELKDVNIEISILSPMKRVPSPDHIELGTHGVYIKRGNSSGVYLPQVAIETGWDKNTFLNSLCVEKAGLETGCWKKADTELYIFTAQVFSE